MSDNRKRSVKRSDSDTAASQAKVRPKRQKAKKAKAVMGRPTPYNPKTHPGFVEALARLGLNDEAIAVKLGISTATLYNWKNQHPDFLEAIKRGKTEPDDAVEASLYKRANGYEQTVQKPMVVGGEVKIVEYTEKVAASDTAIIFTLKNRRPDRWRDKQEVEHTGELNFTNLTPEEFEKRKAELLAKVGKK